MFASVSVWGVVMGGLSAMVVGMIWYSPYLFGKQWTKAMGMSEKEMTARRPKVLPAVIIGSFLTAYVLSLFTVYLQAFTNKGFIMSGFDTAVLAWVGLAGTALLAHGLWEERSKNALYVNLGNRLVTLVVMGLIIGSFLK